MLINLWGHISYFLVDFHEFLILIVIGIVLSFYGAFYIYNSSLTDTKKKVLLSIIFFCLSFILVYSGFEAYFRYRFDESDSLGFLNVTQRWYDRHVVYNNYRYRDNKNYTIAKKPGVIRIGVMGDSNGWGYGIKDVNNRFSNILERKLDKTGYKVEVYNFSIPGLDTWNEIDEYHENVQKFNVDILLWEYFLNDAEPPHSAGTQILQNTQKQIPPIVNFLSDHSYFFDYVYWRFSAKYLTTFTQLRNADLQQYATPSVYAWHKKLIDNFTQELENRHVKIVILVIPFLKFFPNYPAAEIHQRMDRVFHDDGASAVVDLLPYLNGKQAKDLIVNSYDTHPNEYVHNLAAEKLYNVITPLLDKSTTNSTILKGSL